MIYEMKSTWSKISCIIDIVKEKSELDIVAIENIQTEIKKKRMKKANGASVTRG